MKKIDIPSVFSMARHAPTPTRAARAAPWQPSRTHLGSDVFPSCYRLAGLVVKASA